MADKDTTFRLTFENEDMKKVFDSLIERVEATDESIKELEKTQKDAFDSMAKSSKSVNDNLKDQSKRLDVNKVGFKDLKDKGQDALEGIAESGGSATSSIARLGRAGGIAGTVVAGAAALIVAAFLDVKKNANAAKRELEGLKGVGNELKTRTFAGLRALVQAAFGNLGEAAKEAKAAVDNLVGAVEEASEARKQLFDLRQSIGAANSVFITEEARLNVELEKRNALLADETKTTAEKINLLRAAASVENDINENKIIQLTNELFLIKQEGELSDGKQDNLQAIAEIEAELIELRGASQVIAIQTQTEVNALLKEEAELRAKLIGQIEDANALFTGDIDPGAQKERKLEKQIEAFKELRDSISGAGLAGEYEEELNQLDRVIDGLGKRLSDGLAEPLEKLPGALAGSAKEIFSDTQLNLSDRLLLDAEETIDNVQEGIKEKTASFFKGLTEDQRKFLEDTFIDVLGSVGDIIVQGTEVQIEQQESIIDARQDNVSELERQLSEQEKLEAQGLANQSSRLRQSLQEERTILKREQDRRLALEKKAARQRLIANSLQQGSEITLAASKLLNQGASGFIPGLIAAAGGIALLFRIIAQAKANAAAFSTIPQFREGTDYLVGPSHEGGGITIEAEGGERILSRSLNDALGGRKISNDELVDFALKGMNAESAIIPMAAAIASGVSSKQKVSDIQAWERNEVISEVFRTEIRSLKSEMQRAIQERPTYYPTDQSGRREYYKGGTKVVEKILPKNRT